MPYVCVLLKLQSVNALRSNKKLVIDLNQIERMSMQFDQVSVGKKANVYFDGKCVSHTVTLPNGVRKSVGVVLPSTLRFDLSTKEIMEVVDGNAFVSINGAPEQEFKAGQSWEVEKGGYFIIRAEQPVHYVCHFE